MPVVRRELTDFERGEISGLHKGGHTPTDISRILRIPRTTVNSVIQNPQPNRQARTGRPYILTERDERHILLEIRKNPKISYQKLSEILNLYVSSRTIRRMLKKHGIKKWMAKKRPLLTEEHARKRLEFALKYRDWSYDEWSTVIWSDECSIQRGSGVKRD